MRYNVYLKNPVRAEIPTTISTNVKRMFPLEG